MQISRCYLIDITVYTQCFSIAFFFCSFTYRARFTSDAFERLYQAEIQGDEPAVPAARDARVTVRSGRRISGRIRSERGMSVTGPHLSRQRAFGATLVLRLVLEPPRKFVVDEPPPFPLHRVPLSRCTLSLAFLTFPPPVWIQRPTRIAHRHCRRIPLAADATRSFSLHLWLDCRRIVARNKTKREYNTSRSTSVRESPIFIFNDFFDRPRFFIWWKWRGNDGFRVTND